MSRTPARAAPDAMEGLDTRDRILEAGLAEFGEKGLRAASIASICRRARLANGTFYLHFRSTEDLYRALLTKAAMELGRRLREGSTGDLTPKARDRLEVGVIFEFAEECEDLFRLVADERGGYSEAHNAFQAVLHRQRSEEIASGIREGRFRPDLDADLAALADFGMTTEVVQWWLANRAIMSRQAAVDRLADMRAHLLFPSD
ncbi:TetR/AcrR family transcriptional regulator [Parerythrobacter aurantius]|uniref:TetR/AcrR family transcriptional regulator n=1 Tax=Parerythrobacter aurantius TaxID=3127706 RepID=UPI00324B9C41